MLKMPIFFFKDKNGYKHDLKQAHRRQVDLPAPFWGVWPPMTGEAGEHICCLGGDGQGEKGGVLEPLDGKGPPKNLAPSKSCLP